MINAETVISEESGAVREQYSQSGVTSQHISGE